MSQHTASEKAVARIYLALRTLNEAEVQAIAAGLQSLRATCRSDQVTDLERACSHILLTMSKEAELRIAKNQVATIHDHLRQVDQKFNFILNS